MSNWNISFSSWGCFNILHFLLSLLFGQSFFFLFILKHFQFFLFHFHSLNSYNPYDGPNEHPEAELPLVAGKYLYVYGDMDDDGFYEGEPHSLNFRLVLIKSEHWCLVVFLGFLCSSCKYPRLPRMCIIKSVIWAEFNVVLQQAFNKCFLKGWQIKLQIGRAANLSSTLQLHGRVAKKTKKTATLKVSFHWVTYSSFILVSFLC